MRRNVDLNVWRGRLLWIGEDLEGIELRFNLWYTAVWRIDHGDCPSVNFRWFNSARRRTYADSANTLIIYLSHLILKDTLQRKAGLRTIGFVQIRLRGRDMP